MIAYELWEVRSGNLMESFEDEAGALAAVAERAREFGEASVASLALLSVDTEDEDGRHDVLLAAGAELLARARQPA